MYVLVVVLALAFHNSSVATHIYLHCPCVSATGVRGVPRQRLHERSPARLGGVAVGKCCGALHCPTLPGRNFGRSNQATYQLVTVALHTPSCRLCHGKMLSQCCRRARRARRRRPLMLLLQSLCLHSCRCGTCAITRTPARASPQPMKQSLGVRLCDACHFFPSPLTSPPFLTTTVTCIQLHCGLRHLCGRSDLYGVRWARQRQAPFVPGLHRGGAVQCSWKDRLPLCYATSRLLLLRAAPHLVTAGSVSHRRRTRWCPCHYKSLLIS
jgi:hypothetical protein